MDRRAGKHALITGGTGAIGSSAPTERMQGVDGGAGAHR
ncbi:hypothetical protein EHYA_08415 [Embleya hyalina]|uniref:Uncharacterized protein n=1 Tax=Embleya hyalina TaxID=516124 RepID=A0A401Z1G5_9ACTN|nr:hypothetical protein EHYA_08415 [Embleya hyalina]